MVLTIPISSDTETRLKAKAAAAGLDVETYAARHLERVAMDAPNLVAISGSVVDAFKDGGMTEEKLAGFLETEKHQMRTERRARTTD